MPTPPTIDDLIDLLQDIKKINSEITVKALDTIIRAIIALHDNSDDNDDESEEDDGE